MENKDKNINITPQPVYKPNHIKLGTLVKYKEKNPREVVNAVRKTASPKDLNAPKMAFSFDSEAIKAAW